VFWIELQSIFLPFLMPVLAEKQTTELDQKREALQKQLDQLNQELARVFGPRSLRVILPELHSSNVRIDAKNLASYLSIRLAKLCSGLELSYGAVHKNPDSEAIQPALRPVKRILEILYDYFRAPEVIRAWLNSLHPDLGVSPLDAILRNKAEAVETMLENAIAGISS
jgi:hypothetical protein